MKILIAGGTGLIGQALVEALLGEGHEICILTRSPEKAKVKLPRAVTALEWDGTSTVGWGAAIEETDAVINLAGESIAGESLLDILTQRWNTTRKHSIKNSRITTGQALVKAIRDAAKKPEVFIQASAVGYYGPQNDAALPERTPAGDDYLAEVCQAWESSTAEVESLGVRRAVIRTGLVLAPTGGILPIMLLPFRFFVGGRIGNGKQFIPWIHIQDQVDAIRFLLTHETAQGAFNLSAPNPVSNAEFGRVAGQVLGRPNWFPTPGFALKLALGEKATLVLDGQRAVPQQLLEAGYTFQHTTLATALSHLLVKS